MNLRNRFNPLEINFSNTNSRISYRAVPAVYPSVIRNESYLPAASSLCTLQIQHISGGLFSGSNSQSYGLSLYQPEFSQLITSECFDLCGVIETTQDATRHLCSEVNSYLDNIYSYVYVRDVHIGLIYSNRFRFDIVEVSVPYRYCTYNLKDNDSNVAMRFEVAHARKRKVQESINGSYAGLINRKADVYVCSGDWNCTARKHRYDLDTFLKRGNVKQLPTTPKGWRLDDIYHHQGNRIYGEDFQVLELEENMNHLEIEHLPITQKFSLMSIF